MTIETRRAAVVLLALGLPMLAPAVGHAAPAARGYSGPAAVNEPAPPGATPPGTTPPGTTPPGTTPPAETPPAETPPATPPKKTPVVAPSDDEPWDGGFDVVDLTEDKEALAKELEVKTVDVKGDSGMVRGKLKDATTGQPLIGAYVEAIGTPYKTKTDLEGNYALELPPGTYEIRLRSDANEPRRVSGVIVAKGTDETLNSELQPLAGAGQVVAVKAEMNRDSEGARLQQRKESVASRDILSRDSIQKSGSGSTASVATRIVGATVIEGKYLFVRGLGHRYGNTLFDGARIPSPEPDIRTVPLDIFPSGALSAINVQKTFTPDVPGDFAGGSVQLESREIPKKLLFELGLRVGANTSTTFRPIVHSGGFSADGFALGNLPRGLPGEIPTSNPASLGAQDENFQRVWTPKQVERFGESLFTDTRVRHGRIGPPNALGTATLGYGFVPHDGGKLGVLVSAGYRNTHQNLRETWTWYQPEDSDGDGVVDGITGTPETKLEGPRTINNVQWSTIGLVKYEANKRHKLAASAFYSRDADDEVRQLEGFTENGPLLTTRLRYAMRSVLFTRLGGVHEFPAAKNLKFDWFGSFAQARRDDPGIRDMVYQREADNPDAPWQISSSGANLLFMGLKDNTESGGVNFTMPFKQWRQLDGKVKVGAWLEGKQRGFNVRRFTFITPQGLTAPSGTGNILINKNIGDGRSAANGGTAPFVLNETTSEIDNYRANQEIYATYAMLELPFVRWFRIAGGARFEANRQYVGPYDQFTGTVDEENTTKIRNNNVLPAASLIFPATEKMNVRISATQTVARPEFREVAPFLFTDFVGGFSVLGQPGLTSAKIWNGDVRWEWFPSAEEVVAVSVFGKYFDSPIERTMQSGIGRIVSFQNARLAYNVGAEFELRKNLEFMWKRLSNYSVGLNFAYVFSRVYLQNNCDISDPDCDAMDAIDVSTSRIRPLQGQAPFVVNAYLDYDNKKSGTGLRLLYNAVARNIAFVGGSGDPDIYAEAIHQLDFVGRQRIYKGLGGVLQLQNLLNWPIRWSQGPDRRTNYEVYRGATILLGLSYEL